MDSCDVLIVGGGPAGSSCAWKLARGGLDTIVLDKSHFPRHKVCGGWITPAVLHELDIEPEKYGRGRTLQPITGFHTGSMGASEVETTYGKPISYGILRCEFDDYLLKRSGARLYCGDNLTSLERLGEAWIVNGQIRADIIVGAGGHFCPVARLLGADARKEIAVVAQETEFEMSSSQRDACSIRGEIPELYFCSDMQGYGWCFRKGNFLNIGLGRLDARGLPGHVADFLDFLKNKERLGFDVPTPMAGHAYLLLRDMRQNIIGDAVLLTGDAAGLAYSQSGEGIRPAIESGLMAADTILAVNRKYSAANLESYRTRLGLRFGNSHDGWAVSMGRRLPVKLLSSISQQLLATRWFSRHIVLDDWFLHLEEPVLKTQ